ncbi:MAG: hypothetical protein QM831_27095 [Kofleriaceae bacterium]
MRWLVLLVVARVASAEPPRRKVHIDHLDPAKVTQYETARKDWVAWTRDHHVADPWGGTFLQIGGAAFYTLRAFTDWAELDAKSTAKLDPKAQAAYNDRSDDALVPPHHNEIWVREPELDLPGELSGVGTITFDDVKLAGDDYEDAWKAIRTELVAAKYPLVKIAFYSAYGSGRHISLWLAPTKDAFAKVPSIDTVLAKRLGPDRAKALLAKWRGAVLSSSTEELVVRADLSN